MAQVTLSNEQYKRLVAMIAVQGGVLTSIDRFNLLEDAGLRRFETTLNIGGKEGAPPGDAAGDSSEPLPPQVQAPLVSKTTLDDAVQSYEDGDLDRAIFLFPLPPRRAGLSTRSRIILGAR
jgi:hypothetical protein